MNRFCRLLLPCLALAALPTLAAEGTPWPHAIALDATQRIEVYPPQMDSWDGSLLKGRAVVVRAGTATASDPGDDRGTYGTIELEARMLVDKGLRQVDLSQLVVTRAEFPTAGPEAQSWVETIQADFARQAPVVALDRLEALLKESGVEARAGLALLRNDPPSFIFSQKPALLVSLEGPARYVAAQGTSLERVANTRVLLLKDGTNRHYLHLFDGWMTALSLQDPWSVLPDETPDLAKLREQAEQNHAEDLLTGQSAGTDQRSQAGNPPPSLKKGPVPFVYVATTPTELIVTDGRWSWTPIQGTRLLYVSNTTGNILRDNAHQMIYVLVSGRWFRAGNLSGATRNEDLDRLARDRESRAEGQWRDRQLQPSHEGMRGAFGNERLGGAHGGFQGGRPRR